MQVDLEYFAQAAVAAGCRDETIELPDDATLDDLLREAGRRHGETLATLLRDERGALRPWILVAVNGAAVPRAEIPERRLEPEDRVRVMSPIAGG